MKRLITSFALRLLAVAAYFAACRTAPALYRGDEYEFRDFHVDAEYFLDWLVLQPTAEQWMDYREGENAFLGVAGSYTRRELFVMQNLKLRADVMPAADFIFRFEMDQDFDGVYQHHTAGASFPIGDEWAFEFLGEPLAQKEFADIGGAIVKHSGDSQLRLELLLPNFEFAGKNEMDGEFVTQPYTVRYHASRRITPAFEVFLGGDMDLASETDYREPEFRFAYESYKPAAGFIWRPATNQMLWAEAQYETTEKERTGYGETEGTNDFVTDRSFANARIEYVRRTRGGQRYTLGYFHADLDEQNTYPVAIDKTYNLEHTSRMAYGTVTFPLHRYRGARVDFTTGLYLDVVSHHESGADPDSDHSSSGLEGKFPLTLEVTGRRGSVWGGVSFQVDDTAFGGGYGGVSAFF